MNDVEAVGLDGPVRTLSKVRKKFNGDVQAEPDKRIVRRLEHLTWALHERPGGSQSHCNGKWLRIPRALSEIA